MTRKDVAQLEPLSPEIAALFEAERAVPPVTDDLHARLLGRVEASVAQPTVSPTMSAATVGKGLAVAILVGGVGLGLALWSASADETRSDIASSPPDETPEFSEIAMENKPLEVSPPVEAPAFDSVSDDVSAPTLAEPVLERGPEVLASSVEAKAGLPGAARTSRPARATSAQTRTEEHELIASARARLKSHDHAGAQSVLAEHRRMFPKGLYVEEREALSVRAAFASGKLDEARRLRDRFRRNYPRSLHLPGIDALAF